MRKKKKYHQNPMLYIAQPHLEQPIASMQSNYRTPKKKKDRRNVNQPKPEESLHTSNTPIDLEEKSKNEDRKNDKTIKARTKRKRFSEMTIEEKVHYFVGLPSQVPRMKCEIATADEVHVGIITDYDEDGVVYLNTRKRPRNKTVNIDEITDIQLLSF